MVEKKKFVDYVTKGPIYLSLDDERLDHKPGSSVLDFVFNDPVSIGEISFRNNYAAYVTIECKRAPIERETRIRERDTHAKQILVKHKVLMKNPHCETGSQDLIVLQPMNSESWSRIVFIRFILKQPSSLWRRFSIEDITFFAQMPIEPKLPFVPRMFASTSPDIANLNQNLFTKDPTLSAMIKDAISTNSTSTTGNPAIDVAISLQSLKNIVDIMKGVHTSGVTVGRFEVDGSYDIDFLDSR